VAIVESTEWTFAADAAKWMSLFLKVPVSDVACRHLIAEWETYRNELVMEFRRLASERTDDDERIDGIVTELMRLAQGFGAS